MAVTKKESVPNFNEGWITVDTKPDVKLVWENYGDEFIGQYVGEELIERAGYDTFGVYIFTDRDGQRVSVPQLEAIRNGLKRGNVRPGNWVRLIYVEDTDLGDGKVRKEISVDVKR
jgi:hypothetical protein